MRFAPLSQTGFPGKVVKIFHTQFTTKHDGNGLGTKSIKLVAEAHGGEVKAENKSGWVAITLKIPQK